MLEKLIDRTFATRDESHIAHWKTDSGFHHEALGEFYEELIEVLDKFVECHSGAVSTVDRPMPDIVKKLETEMVWLNQNREKLAQDIPALENILDEMTGVYMRTLFKLKSMR